MPTADDLYGDALINLAAREHPPYVVAVPSYERADRIGGRTLATLDRLAVDRDRVTVFVADAAQAEQYEHALAGDWRVAVGCPGLDACRKFYANAHYPAGTRILNIDDDVDDIHAKADKKLERWGGTLDQLAAIGWEIAAAVGAQLWGLASAANAFYLHDEAVAGLRYVCGILFGSIAGDSASHDMAAPAVSSGADFERSIRSYLVYGSVVRVDWLAPKTTYFGAGGMQAELGGKDERARDHAAALTAIAGRYPKYARVVMKANGVPNLRLKPSTVLRIGRRSVEGSLRS